mgnify:FL=1
MNPTSQSFRHEAEKTFTSTSEFHFPGMEQGLASANENAPETLVNSCFELVPKGQMAPKLKLIFKNGNRCTFPYAYLLRTEYDTNGILTLFTSEKEIVIEGRGLDFIEDMLYGNQVKWIQESLATLDVIQEKVFIKGMEIRER